MSATKFQFGKASLSRIAEIDPLLMKVLFRAIRISSTRIDGVDFGVPKYGGFRTVSDQQELYAIGRTTELHRSPVTHADGVEKKSKHQSKKAVDVIPFVDGKPVWNDEALFHKIAVCMLQASSELGIRLAWGGNWSTFKDLPHYELL